MRISNQFDLLGRFVGLKFPVGHEPMPLPLDKRRNHDSIMSHNEKMAEFKERQRKHAVIDGRVGQVIAISSRDTILIRGQDGSLGWFDPSNVDVVGISLDFLETRIESIP